MALWCWAGFSGAHFLRAHHVGSTLEIDTFWRAVANTGATNGFLVWVLYLALEPWVRRRWPQTMISWSRYVVKGWRDPLVGRDLLYAVGIGAAFTLLDLLQVMLRDPAQPPEFSGYLYALLGVAQSTSALLLAFGAEVTDTLLIFFVLFLSRLALRKEWLAVIATIAIVGAIDFFGGLSLAALRLDIIFLAILTITMLRFGLIAAIFAYATREILLIPHTVDFSAWYLGAAMTPVILLALLAIYGFRTSLGGRRLIRLPD